MVELEDSEETLETDIWHFIVKMPTGEKVASQEVRLASTVELSPTEPLELQVLF